MITQKDVPISDITTFKNSGNISTLMTFEDIDDLSSFVKKASRFFVIGKGSNTLINPQTSVSTFIKLSPVLTDLQREGLFITVPAGMSGNKLLKTAQMMGLGGLEFIAGVPTTVGGMVAMNFGCWGYEFADFIDSVQVMNSEGEIEWLSNEELSFSYRYSNIEENNRIILAVRLELVADHALKIHKRSQENIHLRLSKQPLRGNTFGSVFKNPDNDYAGRLIEVLGYKGTPFRKYIKMSEAHANFMLNEGHGQFEEAMALIEDIQERTKSEFGIDLELEVKIV
tara:strand:- start:1532 stop:2380 length:849 start_codon:yes stop_codon:yes gene_type:complete